MQQTLSQKHNQSHSWLFGLILSTVMMICVFLFFGLRYDTIDDTVILRQMMGFGVTEIPDFNLYVNGILFFFLRWLSILFPGLPWFSYLQLFLLWLSTAVITKSIIQCFENEQHPVWHGIILAVLFQIVFLLRYETRITYTVTAAMVGAAAVAQLLSIDAKNASEAQWYRACLLSLALILFSYNLRPQSVLPALAFCFCAFIIQGVRRYQAARNWLRPLAVTFVVVVVVLGAAVGFRAWETNAWPDVREYVDWQNARIRIWDYLGVGNTPKETLEELGITEAHKELLQDWYQMDGSLDTQALTTMADAIEATRDNRFSTNIASMSTVIKQLFQEEPLVLRSLWVLGSMLLLCLLLWGMGGKRSNSTPVWGSLVGLFFSVAMVLYLAYQGRLNLRGFLTVMLPFAALVACLLPQSRTHTVRVAGKAIGAVACAVLLFASTLYCIPFLQTHLRKPPTEKELATEAVLAAIDDYATANEDYLLIYDGSLAIDTRMFPTTENGISKNVHLWGGWNLHSPSYNAMLEAYGFDPDQWSLEDFLSYDVRLLRRNAAMPTALLNALNELGDVECCLDTEWDELYVMSFEEW